MAWLVRVTVDLVSRPESQACWVQHADGPVSHGFACDLQESPMPERLVVLCQDCSPVAGEPSSVL